MKTVQTQEHHVQKRKAGGRMKFRTSNTTGGNGQLLLAGSSHFNITPMPCDSLFFSLSLSHKLPGRITHSSFCMNEPSLVAAAEAWVLGAEWGQE